MLTLLSIQDFMSKALRGDTDVPPSVLEEFAEDCRATADQLRRTKGEWRIRMSGLGRPVCQQILDKQGIEESMSYNTLFRFLFGDITESIIMLIMKEAGVDIVDYQRPVELDLDGVTVKGTLDVIIRDESGVEKVWDIKSASDYAYKSKFTGFEGYEGIKKDDPFGYVMQGFLYSEAAGMPFGGWIVVNKSSGEVACVEVPDWCQEDKEEYLEEAKRRVKLLTDPDVKFLSRIRIHSKPTGVRAKTYAQATRFLQKSATCAATGITAGLTPSCIPKLHLRLRTLRRCGTLA